MNIIYLLTKYSLQEESRRWTLSVFCEKLKEYEEDVEMADHFTSALITLMEGSRINKEALLKFNMLDLLKRWGGTLDYTLIRTAKAMCKIPYLIIPY